jgi:hypothetical protein
MVLVCNMCGPKEEFQILFRIGMLNTMNCSLEAIKFTKNKN